MEAALIVHQGVLCAHLLAFAIALSAVLREDLALLRSRQVDLPRLQATARTLGAALGVLWLSGALLAALGGAGEALSAKLAAKLVVVSALTVNGVALHALAFPLLRRGSALPEHGRRGVGIGLPVVLGAVSTASWLMASFVGAARIVAPALQFHDFMALYAVSLATAVAVGLFVVLPRFGPRLVFIDRGGSS